MDQEAIEKIKNHLKLIEAQAAIMVSELKPDSLWLSDQQRQLDIIKQAVTQIGIIRDFNSGS